MTDRRLATIPEGLKVGCDQAVELPDPLPPIGNPKTIKLWGMDRAALGECRRRHRALADAVNQLDKPRTGMTE